MNDPIKVEHTVFQKLCIGARFYFGWLSGDTGKNTVQIRGSGLHHFHDVPVTRIIEDERLCYDRYFGKGEAE